MLKHFILFVFVIVLKAQFKQKYNLWNEQVKIQGLISKSPQLRNRQSYQQLPFLIQILSNKTILVTINDLSSKYIEFSAPITWTSTFSLSSGQILITKNTQISGKLNYTIQNGIVWYYKIDIKKLDISIQGIQKSKQNIGVLLVILFSCTSFFAIPIFQRQKNSLIYNIKKRTPLLTMIFILVKFTTIFSGLVIYGLKTVIYSSLYLGAIWVVVYFIFLCVPLIHFLILLIVVQKQFNENQYFKTMNKNSQLFLFSAILASFVIIPLCLCFLAKNIIFLYFLSLGMVFNYLMASRNKIYAFGRVIFYDFILTVCLSMFSLFFPLLNYSPVSIKQFLLFWNFYILLFILGFIAMKRFIMIQTTNEITIEQVSFQNQSQKNYMTKENRISQTELS